MNTIIKANLNTLQKANFLLSNVSNDILTNKSIAPYYSSVGSHLRHILDFYNCILKPNNVFDLTDRNRNQAVESDCSSALGYLDELTKSLKNLDTIDLTRKVCVFDDLGSGKVEIEYIYGSLLAQANSHAIHHYAIINYILDGLNVSVSDKDFGYNPTTPKPVDLN